MRNSTTGWTVEDIKDPVFVESCRRSLQLPSPCTTQSRTCRTGSDLTSASALASAVIETRRSVLVPQAEKERRRVAKERKEVQQKKNLKMEKISNPATIKRMMKSKKQRKLLVTADPAA